MAQIPFQHGEQYVYTNGPMGPEYVTFVYPGINHYNFMDADGRTIRLSHSEAVSFIQPLNTYAPHHLRKLIRRQRLRIG